MTDYSYIGKGKLHVRAYGTTAGFIAVGNCSALNLAVSEDIKELPDYTAAGGGTYNESRRIQAVEMTYSVHDISPENLKRALFGSQTAVTAGSVSGESITAYVGALCRSAFPIDIAETVTVVSAAGTAATGWLATTAYSLGDVKVPTTPNGFYYEVTTAGTTDGTEPAWPTTVGGTVVDGTVTWTCMGRVTLTADTDFVVSGGGISIPAAGRITDGEVLTVGYTKAAAQVIEALTQSAQEYELFFDGLNEARSGKPVLVEIWRVKLGALANLALIGDDYGVIEQGGKLLTDSTKVGADTSKFFRTTVVA